MSDDINTGPAGEQTTAADIDPGALAQLKRLLGELSGGELDLTDMQVRDLVPVFGIPIATTTRSDGKVTLRRFFGLPRVCRDAKLLDVAGQASTAGNGAVTLLLSDFLCVDRLSVDPPVNLVATPLSTRPVYVTTQYKLVPDPAVPGANSDLEVTLMAWSSGGSPASQVAIDWRCRLVNYDLFV